MFKFNQTVLILLIGVLGLSVRVSADAPTYSVSVGGGSFNPNPICGGMTATATVTGSLNVKNSSTEIQESKDSWGWTATVTGYAPSSTATYTSVPSGITPSVVGASSGSATSSVTATAGQTTSPGYYQVTVAGTDSFILTDSSTSPATVTSTSRSGSTLLYITVVAIGGLQYLTPNAGYVAVPSVLNVLNGKSITFRALPAPSDASFPTGKPVWGGTSGASGTGPTVTVTFSTTSSSLTDYKTVTATCGNTLTANVLVVQISAINASIPSTPAVTLRSPNTANKPSWTFSTSQTSATWAAGGATSIVLVEGSTTVPLQATVLPNGFVPSWTVIRNPQDAAGLKQAPYPAQDLSLNTNSGSTNTVSLNAVGSFSVICYVDTYRSNTFSPATEGGVFFNVVSARITYHQDASTSPTPSTNTQPTYFNGAYYVNSVPVLNYTGNTSTMGPLFGASTGIFDITQPTAAAEYLNCQVDLVAGGNDGALGLDRVYTGWCQNISVNGVTGNYQNSHSTHGLVTNGNITGTVNGPPPNNHLTQTSLLPSVLSPALSASAPILDTGQLAPSTGGATVCLTRSTDTNTPSQSLGLGQRRTTEAVDSPGNVVPINCPLTGTDQLKQFIYNLTFRAYLIVWTGTNNGSPSEPGASLYSVVEEVPWSIGTTLTLSPPGNPNTANPAIAVTTSPIVTHVPTVRIEAVGGETYLPRILDRAEVYDATH